jgi:hypothetical protein
MEYVNMEKLINSILYFIKKVKYPGKTKICKLLFNLDFTHFKETGKSVTGLNYYAWKFKNQICRFSRNVKKEF